jgi:hypothetical protein
MGFIYNPYKTVCKPKDLGKMLEKVHETRVYDLPGVLQLGIIYNT